MKVRNMSFMQALREKLTEVKEDIIADKSISAVFSVFSSL